MAEGEQLASPDNDQAAIDAAAASEAQRVIQAAQEEARKRKLQIDQTLRQQQSRYAAWRLRQTDDLHRRQQHMALVRMSAERSVFAHSQARAQELAALEDRINQYSEGIQRAISFTSNPNYTDWQPGGGTALTLPEPTGG